MERDRCWLGLSMLFAVGSFAALVMLVLHITGISRSSAIDLLKIAGVLWAISDIAFFASMACGHVGLSEVLWSIIAPVADVIVMFFLLLGWIPGSHRTA